MQTHRRLLPYFLLLYLLFLGCDNGVEPEPEDQSTPSFSFSPNPGHLDVTVGELYIFRIDHRPDPTFTVDWRINGSYAGLGPRYGYRSKSPGQDTLSALARWGGDTEQRRWLVRSVADSATTVSFLPVQRFFEVTLGDTIRFKAISSRPERTSYRWDSNGQMTSEGASYLYTAVAAGRDTLRVIAGTPGYDYSQVWLVDAYAPGRLQPLPPLAAAASIGDQIASVVVSWRAPAARGDAIARYVVAAGYDGPLDESNWSSAEILGEVAATPGDDLFSVLYTAANPGLHPGAHAWISVASLNSYGVMCPRPPNREVDLTEPWWISGAVTDETGAPLADILIHDIGLAPEARTGSDGRYRVGPFADTAAVTLRTETLDVSLPDAVGEAWYDVVGETLAFRGPQHQDFQLVDRRGLTSPCSNYDGDFLAFLRGLTRTVWPTNDRPNVKLYKWASYPVPVWIPEFINSSGLDYGALCRQTVVWWNEAMGSEYLTLVATKAEARIVFRFADDDPGAFGRVDLQLPAGGFVMGEVIPERVEVYLSDELAPAQFMQEIALHELGHALGLSGHATCSDGGYLMAILPTGRLDNGPGNAIHFDEKRALTAVRALPQGYDMSRIEDPGD